MRSAGSARLTLSLLALVGASLGTSACSSKSLQGGPPEILDNGTAALREDEIRAALGTGTVELDVPLTKKSGDRLTGRLSARLVDLTKSPEVTLGIQILDVAQTEARQVHTLTIAGLPVTVDRAATAGLVIVWSVDFPEGELRGRTSLYGALGKLEVELRGATEVPRGAAVPFRVIARDPNTLGARPGARVTGTLTVGDAAPVTVFEGRTDARGEHLAMVSLPAGVESGALRIDVADDTASSWATATVRAVGTETLALSTDKTIYKPGQTIHLRLLGLSSADKTPLAGQDVLVEVLDGKGNKIIKRHATTDEYGVAALALATAVEVNEGAWTLRAEVAGVRAERKVPVTRYNLPKMKVEVLPERGFVVPGDTVAGVIDARYLFGAPVGGAEVVLRAAIGDATIGQQRLRTQADGRVPFALLVPAGTTAARLEDGGAAVALEVEVTDSAGQIETAARALPLAPGPLVVRVVQETEALIPGAENVLWLVLQDPAGRPIAGSLGVTISGARQALTTGADGVAELRFTPAATLTTLPVEIEAQDGANRRQTRSLTLTARAGGSILVRTDKARYLAGETAHVSVRATAGVRRVHLDVYRGGAGVVAEALDLDASGQGQLDVVVTPAMRGLLVLDALALGTAGEVVRGSARALVDPEDRLEVVMETGRATYAPGDAATVRVRVRDAAGAPKVAALGMTAVDEAVFALGGEPDDDLRGIFSLDRRSLPRGVGASALLGMEERALRIALAGSSPLAGLEYNSVREELPAVRRTLEARVRLDLVAYLKRIAPQLLNQEIDESLARDRVLPGARSLVDPFGQTYEATLGTSADVLRLQSSGPDERLGSSDDVTVELWYGWARWSSADQVDDTGNVRNQFEADAAAGGPPNGAPAPPQAPTDPTAAPGTEGGAAKVRADFRETIYVNPTLITDARGEASVSFPLADSITTWRVTAHGSTRDGRVGSGRLGFRTFQGFFVDFDVPTDLTRADVVELPAVVYNYLSTPTTVQVTLEPAAWMRIDGPAQQSVTLGPSEVRAVSFRIEALRAGTHQLTLRGQAGAVGDALVREARVAPGGTKEEVSFSDKINGTRTHTFTVPADAIEGSTRVLLTLTPGFAGEAVSGTEALLKEPGGCFEQTTSSAWPNTLVTQYLDVTGQLTPELRERAFSLVSTGYQRLLTFESPTGGFNWWGDADPGNRILSAIMLWHLKDMEGVIETDPAVRDRTLAWLLSQQQADGSWSAGDALHAGNEVLGTSVARTTAFISWALAHTGWADAAVERASAYLRANLPDEADLYANALAANALGFVDPSGAATSELFARLDRAKVEGVEGRIEWPTEAPSWTGASGDAAAIETTGLVAYGLIKARAYPGNAAGAVKYIVGNKDAVGTWYNTQATMNALRALLAAASPQGSEAEGTLTVAVNGAASAPVAITRADGDVHQVIDLTGAVRAGENTVSITMAGQGELSYHLARRVHRPAAPTATSPELALDVQYESETLTVGQPVRAAVQATYRGAGRRDQVIVRVGVAPGFAPLDADVDAIVADGRASRVEKNAGDVTFYLMGVGSGESRDLSFRMIPRLPGAVQAPASVVYAYYESSIRAVVAPTALVVTAAP